MLHYASLPILELPSTVSASLAWKGRGMQPCCLVQELDGHHPRWPTADQRPGVFSHTALLRAQGYLTGNAAQSLTCIIPAECGVSLGAQPAYPCCLASLPASIAPAPEGLESWLLPLKHSCAPLAIGLAHVYASLRVALADLDLGRGKFC